jgi:hypothetical protein
MISDKDNSCPFCNEALSLAKLAMGPFKTAGETVAVTDRSPEKPRLQRVTFDTAVSRGASENGTAGLTESEKSGRTSIAMFTECTI